MIYNLKTTWPTKIDAIFEFLEHFLYDVYAIFQKGVDYFEIEHKTC